MHRVLVVDSEPATGNVCRQALGTQDCEVHTAGNLEELFAALKKRSFDLVLLDASVTGGEGPEEVRRITAAFPSTAIVVMGPGTALPSAASYLQAGALDYVARPLEPEKLAAAAERAIALSRGWKRRNGSRESGYLVTLVEEMNRRRSREELLSFILGHAASTLQADTGSILMYEPRENLLRLMSHIGSESLIGSTVKMGERIAGWVAQNRKPLLLHNPSELPQFKNWAANSDIASSIVVPLVQHTRLLGVICLNRHADRAGRTYTREDLDSLESFAIHSSYILGLRDPDTAHKPDEGA